MFFYQVYSSYLHLATMIPKNPTKYKTWWLLPSWESHATKSRWPCNCKKSNSLQPGSCWKKHTHIHQTQDGGFGFLGATQFYNLETSWRPCLFYSSSSSDTKCTLSGESPDIITPSELPAASHRRSWSPPQMAPCSTLVLVYKCTSSTQCNVERTKCARHDSTWVLIFWGARCQYCHLSFVKCSMHKMISTHWLVLSFLWRIYYRSAESSGTRQLLAMNVQLHNWWHFSTIFNDSLCGCGLWYQM